MNERQFIIYLLIFIFVTFLAVFQYDYDYDLFARLEVGEIFFKLKTVLLQDPFSYTPTHTWYDHEWGSGVVFYFILKYFKPIGIILFQALMSRSIR